MTTERDTSEVRIQNGIVSFNGPDAVALYRVSVLVSAIRVYLATGQKVNTAYTVGNMLRTASNITQKVYPASRRGLEQARVDLIVWRDNMTLALPVEVVR